MAKKLSDFFGDVIFPIILLGVVILAIYLWGAQVEAFYAQCTERLHAYLTPSLGAGLAEAATIAAMFMVPLSLGAIAVAAYGVVVSLDGETSVFHPLLWAIIVLTAAAAILIGYGTFGITLYEACNGHPIFLHTLATFFTIGSIGVATAQMMQYPDRRQRRVYIACNVAAALALFLLIKSSPQSSVLGALAASTIIAGYGIFFGSLVWNALHNSSEPLRGFGQWKWLQEHPRARFYVALTFAAATALYLVLARHKQVSGTEAVLTFGAAVASWWWAYVEWKRRNRREPRPLHSILGLKRIDPKD